MTALATHPTFMQLPLGFAHFKVSINQQDEIEGIRLLEANEAFRKIIGSDDTSTRGDSIALPCVGDGSLSWVGSFRDIVLTGGSRESNVQISQRWYKVTAASTEKRCFCTVLTDITPEITRIAQLQEQNAQTEKVSAELDTLINCAPNAIFLVEHHNGEFRYVRNNVYHQKLTGFSHSSIRGKTPIDVIGREIGETWNKYYLQCVESGKAIFFEESLPFGGQMHDWLINLAPVKRGGIVTHVIGIRMNITEVRSLRRQNDQLLRRMQSMFNEHIAIMLIIEPKTGRIVDANPAACRFYGYTKEELLRMRVQDINTMPPEDVQRLRLQALTAHQDYFLFPHRLKNGETRMVDVYSSPVSYGNDTLLFSVIFDVTDREQYKEDLYREKKLLSITLNSIGDGVVTTDNEGKITGLNRSAEEITGWYEDEAKSTLFSHVFRLQNEDTGQEVENPISKVLQTGKVIGLANHTVLLNRQNMPIPIADSAAPILDENGQCYGVVMVFRDVSVEAEHRKQILYLSYHDSLTGLYNRRYVEDKKSDIDIPEHLPLAVIMGDVNGLKVTNDVFGHIAGDKLLQNVAHIMAESSGSNDIIARWGGDEFLILMPNSGPDAAQRMIQKLTERFRERSVETMQISVSLGGNVKTQAQEDLQIVLQKAEELMYHQKLLDGKSYRNNIISTLLATLYEKSMETQEHATRLEEYCYMIAEELHINSEELNELSLLAILHDIGKVGIPIDILQKAGTLSPEEWAEMKLHPEIGYRIAQNTPELSLVSEYILSHHERWDGKGYPSGLSGREIPLLCRILAIADSFDAMTNDRVYRKAMSREAALQELIDNRGTQFDPELVDIFIRRMNARL